MPEINDQQQKEFMIEKIKERPVNKKKLLRRTLTTASMAVIFGLIACFTFLVLEPVISNFLYPEEEAQIVLFPEEQQEMSPEQMLTNTMLEQQEQKEQQQQVEQEVEQIKEQFKISEEQIQSILARVVMDKDSYRQLYTSLSKYVNELSRSMVTVTCVSSDVDILDNVMEKSNQTFGVIIANNGKELLILTNYLAIKGAEQLSVTFDNNAIVPAVVKEYNKETGLCVLAVDHTNLSPAFLAVVQIAPLGTSNNNTLEGVPVIALGSPMGSNGSIGYGIVAATNQYLGLDANYKLLQTDIYGSQYAGGVLFNMQGSIIGVICRNKSGSDMRNLITAFGISDLRKVIEKMSNGKKTASMGITGMDVSIEANDDFGVPFGAYVKEVEMDSPAMLAGIQQGDVIVSLGGINVQKYIEYTNALMSMEPGDNINVVVMRQSQNEYKEMTLNITLGEAGGY